MSFISYLINGISLGSVYALIALGYTMVYGIAKMLNLAHEMCIRDRGRGKKVIVYKYKRKTGYHKKNGHRQAYTQVKIEKINA